MTNMTVSRRTLLKAGALAGVGAAMPFRWLASAPPVRAAAASDRLRKFIQPLRGVGAAGGIPLAQPDAVVPPWVQKGATHYTIDIAQYDDMLHPALPNATRLWGYGQGSTKGFRHLGAVIAAKRGTPVQVTFRNKLPDAHILPVDTTIMGTEFGPSRTAVHLHGGKVPWTSDGVPHAWWNGINHSQGVSFVNNEVLRAGQTVPANEAEYYYPNDQGSRLMWYHDHALGITRLNAYAGVASGYVIYDDYELGLVATGNLPGPLDPRTVYLVFQDKTFVSAATAIDDPTWYDAMPNSRPGDLWYAHEYDMADWGGPGYDLPPALSAVPEYFGDTILVNGTVYPYLEVEPRQYRLRLLNACNSRFLNPRLVYAKGGGQFLSTEPGAVAGPAFVQIQSEGGFLPAPVYLDGSESSRLLLAPAERADLIVDFRNVPVGSKLILVNDAPSPYPGGDGVLVTDAPGYGPDARTLLQFRVTKRMGGADKPISLPMAFTPTDPFLVPQVPGEPTAAPAGVPVRRLTLNEGFDGYGRLLQMLGTDAEVAPGAGFGRAYEDEPTESVSAGATEVWEILNLSEDTHPIHFHLANVQVLSRRRFVVEGYAGGEPAWDGEAFAPDSNELGWKETVRMNAGEATRVLMRFELPTQPFVVPESPRTGGNEYVWHCHILEHEEHDMMRPLIVS
jgi:spore coat protein A